MTLNMWCIWFQYGTRGIQSEQWTHHSNLHICCHHLLHHCVWMSCPEKVPVNEEDHTTAQSDETKCELPSSFPWFSSSVSNHPEYSRATGQFSRKSTTETNNNKQTNKLQITLEALSTGSTVLKSRPEPYSAYKSGERRGLLQSKNNKRNL